MSDQSNRRLRTHALAAATAIALSSMLAATASAAERVNVSALQTSEQYDRFIVKYRDGSEAQSNHAALRAKLKQAAKVLPPTASKCTVVIQHLRRIATGAEVVRTSKKLDKAEAETLMRQLAADPSVEYVEVDQLMQAILTPNDTRYSEQWGYYEATGGIKANEAWNSSTGTGVVVAVLDTGITNHSDLNGNIIAGYDMISDATVAGDGGGRDSDPNDPGDYYNGQNSSWHGTHVAGTVAAITNNANGVAGTAYTAKVVPVRVLGRGGGYTSDIADGIVWASGGSVSGVPANANPAEVINMSLGGSGTCSSTYQNAINGAVGRGTTVVVAAGNSNVNVSNSVPANCSNVVAVAATDRNCTRASFSNYGTGIDVSGPGVGILDTELRHHLARDRELRFLQRHLDGGAACRRRDGADAGGRTIAIDPRCSRVDAQEHGACFAGSVLRGLRRRHRQRQGRGGCGGRHHATSNRKHPGQGYAGHRPVGLHRQLDQLHDDRARGRQQSELQHVRRVG